jgi:FkbH-like protein
VLRDETARASVPDPRNPRTAQTPQSLLARAREAAPAEAAKLLGRMSDLSNELPHWLSAARVLPAAGDAKPGWARRYLRIAVVGSHTTGQLVSILPVALARHGVAASVYESPYGQYEQEILDPSSGLYAFAPDVVLLLIDERELRLPAISEDPARDLAAETSRWTSLWAVLRERAGATILQTTFVPRTDDGLGHVALATPGSRRQLVRALNLQLGQQLPGGVQLIDAEQLAAAIGTDRWTDARYWFLAKQSVGLAALPALARQLGSVIAATAGLSSKVVVLDLDNTLWGGVIGEDGLAGIVLGNGPSGEAFQAFQESLLALRRRGVLLAVVSKNNDADAREPFLKHPDMRLGLDDLVAFRASWDDKAAVIRQLAEDLSLGLDAFVFVDDNPFEREAVRAALPEVEVLDLPADPTGYPAALARHPSLEPAALTAEDAARTRQYQALAEAGAARAAAATPEEYLAGLEMTATFEPVDETTLARVVQLIGKTNQFTLTARRHGEAAVQAMLDQPGAIALTMRLSDRYVDHGLVGVVIAVPAAENTLRVDTWLMSCRVLGRGAEVTTMAVLTDAARRQGYTTVLGEHIATGRNEPARSAYERSGFTAGGVEGDSSTWTFDLTADTVPDPGHIKVLTQP